MEIKKHLANKSNYGGTRSTGSIQYIVVHYTANDGDTDENNGKYFANNVVKASAHYFVDDDSATQSVLDNCIAYSVGGSRYSNYKQTGGAKFYGQCTNANSISVEICDDVKNGTVYPSAKTISNALELVRMLMVKYNIPAARVIRHFDVNGKPCPAYWCGTADKNAKWVSEFWGKLPGAANSTGTASKVTYTKIKGGYLCEIPMHLIERVEYCPMSGTKGETVTAAAKRIKWSGRAPDIITNAELFTSSYAPASGLVNDGKNVKLTEQYGIAFRDRKTPVFSYKNNVNAPDWLGAYPVLVNGGKIGFTSVPPGLAGNRARTCLGIKGDVFGVLVIPEQFGGSDATLQEAAQVFIERGYESAINLDGGGSTAYQTPEYGYEQNRKVRGFVCIWYKGGKGNKASKAAGGSTAGGSNAWTPKVGETVYFNGTTHYINSSAANGSACSKGLAQITRITSGKHPYHLKRTGKSGPYGWVDAGTFTRKDEAPAQTTKKSNEAVAREVIAGKWGNGDARRKKLEAAGYDYATIQQLVNKIV